MYGSLLGVEESGGELFAGAGVMDVLPLEPGVVEDDSPPDVDGVIDVPPLEPGVVEDDPVPDVDGVMDVPPLEPGVVV